MQEVINALEQAEQALLVVAAERLAVNPDVAAELIGVRRQIQNLAQHLKDLDNV